MEYELLNQPGQQGGDSNEDPKKAKNGNNNEGDPPEGIVHLSVANFAPGRDIDDSDVFNLRFLEFVHQVLLLGMEMLKMHGQYAFGAT